MTTLEILAIVFGSVFTYCALVGAVRAWLLREHPPSHGADEWRLIISVFWPLTLPMFGAQALVTRRLRDRDVPRAKVRR